MSRSGWLFLGPFVACAPDGAEVGSRSPLGATEFRWHDALGVQVTIGSEYVYFDADGIAWGLDPESGGVRRWAVLLEVLYASAGCQGDSAVDVVPYLLPGVAIELAGVDEGDDLPEFVARPVTLRANDQEFCPQSVMYIGDCQDETFTYDCVGGSHPWVPFDELVEIHPPELEFAAPFHPEPVW
jgi:hypothetical protein